MSDAASALGVYPLHPAASLGAMTPVPPWMRQQNPLAVPPTPADAYEASAKSAAQWLAAERESGVKAGVIDPKSGWPTQDAILDAVQQWTGALMGETEAPGFRAFHGSPHSFDRFDLGKIGTGEGAQAFGHGLYFAENEAVARSYRDRLSRINQDHDFVMDGKPYHQDEIDFILDEHPDAYTSLAALMRHNFDRQKARDDLVKDLGVPYSVSNWSDSDIAERLSLFGQPNGPNEIAAERAKYAAEDAAKAAQAKRSLAWFDAHNASVQPPERKPGSMYEVNITANPAHFLDWDAPLGEQSPHAQAAIAKLKQMVPEDFWPSNDKAGGYQVANAVRAAIRYGYAPNPAGNVEESLTAALQSAGIKGIRYLDGASRDAGEGTRNTVIFDPATIEILRKYGIAGLIAGGGAAVLGAQPAPSTDKP